MMVQLFDDSNYSELVRGIVDRGLVAGCLPRKTAYGECPGAAPLSAAMKLIPRSEWPDRIRAKDAEKSWLEDLVRGNVPCNNQNPLNYCWAYSATMATMVQRYVCGLGYRELAPESLGELVNYRNRGYYLDKALGMICDKGIASREFVPIHDLNTRNWDAAWKTDRENYRITEWFDLDEPSGMFDAVATCALCNIPSFVGFQWWSHAISGSYRLLDLGKKFALRYRNNWGPEEGDDGFIDLAEGKGTPDLGAFAPRAVTVA